MGSFSIWHWLIVLAIVVLVFGTKKLKNIGRRPRVGRQGFSRMACVTARPSEPTDPQKVANRDPRRRHNTVHVETKTKS